MPITTELAVPCCDAGLSIGLHRICSEADLEGISISLCDWRWWQTEEGALAS